MRQRVGFWAAVLTVLLTAATAVAGVATPARRGPFCGPTTWACVPAPYTDVAQFIPGDYLWLIPAILLAPVFVVLMAAVHDYAPEPRRIFSRIALAFALAYAVVIGVDYFTQFAVVIPSLQAGETEGLSLFTQYNPHGLFIAGEAFGYLAMSLALLFAARSSRRPDRARHPLAVHRRLRVGRGGVGRVLDRRRRPHRLRGRGPLDRLDHPHRLGRAPECRLPACAAGHGGEAKP